MSEAINDQLTTIRPAAHLRSAGWLVRRALLGVLALSIFVLASACLLYASIEQDDAAFAEQAPSQSE